MVNSLLTRALDYVSKGWKVLPLHSVKDSLCSCKNHRCSSQGKHPRIHHWKRGCSSDPNKITDWWSKWPDANIGLATGSASGFFAVDIDRWHFEKKAFQNLMKKYGMHGNTLSSTTGGGGYHLLFKMPDNKVSNLANILPGIDIRGDGGYIVAPPSQHFSGAHYRWKTDPEDCEILDAPSQLVDLAIYPSKPFARVDFRNEEEHASISDRYFFTRD